MDAPLLKPQARKSPEWLTRSVMYQIFLRAFTPEGTLKAAEKKLPELAELGVDILYLCPICLQDDDPRGEFWSPRQQRFDNPRNPYRIKDFYAIDPEYGSDADLRSFVASAHKLGMRTLLDLVYAHCGPTPSFLDEHPDYVKRDADGKLMNCGWNFPSLNFESAGLREHLWRNMEHWVANFDVDGFRCDISGCVPLDFWETGRTRLEKLKPEIIILSEGTKKEDQLQAFDMNYTGWGFSGLRAAFNQLKPASHLRAECERMAEEHPAGARFIRFFDNHDIAHNTSQGVRRETGKSDEAWRAEIEFNGIPDGGMPPDNRNDKSFGVAYSNAALALMFALDGVPFLYNGQEVADTAEHNLFAKAPVNWANGATPTGKARRALVKQLCALRHSERALSDGAITWLDNAAPEQLLSFSRELGEERVIVIVNLGKERQVVRGEAFAEFAPSVILLEQGARPSDGGFTLDTYGFIVARKANK